MAKQFIQRIGGFKRVNNRYSGDRRDTGAKSEARESRFRRQRLLDEAMATDDFTTGEPLETSRYGLDGTPAGDSREDSSDDGQLNVTYLYTSDGRISAALCRPRR